MVNAKPGWDVLGPSGQSTFRPYLPYTIVCTLRILASAMAPFGTIGRCISLQCRSTKQGRFVLSHPSALSYMVTRNLASSHTQDDPEQVTSADAHGSHESHYDPPTGWLWGIPPGEKPEKEGWENTWVYGYWGSLLLGVVLYAYKPDTS